MASARSEGGHLVGGAPAEVGWWLSPKWWGRGVATVAARRYVNYCFGDLDLHRVEAGVFVSNPASARVAEKAGLVLEGVAGHGDSKGGHLVDRLLYGLTRSEYQHRGVVS